MSLMSQGFGPNTNPGSIITSGYVNPIIAVITYASLQGRSSKRKILEAYDTFKIKAMLVAINDNLVSPPLSRTITRVIAESSVSVGKIITSKITNRVTKHDYKIIISEVKTNKD